MNQPAALTPTEIDTALAAIDRKLFVADQVASNAVDRVALYERYIAKDEWSAARYRPYLDEAREKATEAAAAVEALHAEAAPLNDEYDRRGGWSRTWMVLNTGGHAHRGTGYHNRPHCSTCFPTTRYGWLPQLAGATEDEIVAAIGESACTTCFPSAPTTPRTVFTIEESEARAEAEAKAAEKAAKDAAKAAKAIRAADGGVLKDRFGFEVKTEQTAQNMYVADLAYAVGLTAAARSGDDTKHAEHLASLATEYRTQAERYLAALATKRGTTVEAQREALAPKVAAKVRKAAREAAATNWS